MYDAHNIVEEILDGVDERQIARALMLAKVKSNDNLMYSDYVLVVEGPSDKLFFTKLLQRDEKLCKLMELTLRRDK